MKADKKTSKEILNMEDPSLQGVDYHLVNELNEIYNEIYNKVSKNKWRGIRVLFFRHHMALHSSAHH